MKKSGLSGKDAALLVILVILLIGVGYYMFFYQPLQEELADIDKQSTDMDAQIDVAMTQVGSMNAMQAELDEILAQPADKITEIATYDNAKELMNELNGILSKSLEYKLNFSDPKITYDTPADSKDAENPQSGTVRRSVSITFRCESYTTAKGIIEELVRSHWRSLVSDLTVTSVNKNLVEPDVEVKATIIFFERLVAEEPAPTEGD